MRWQRAALVGVVSLMVLAGCVSSRAPETIQLKVHLMKDEGGKPIGVEIDKAFHDSGVVGPGDRIAWICECPEGTEFRVEKLHFAGDLDYLVDLFSETESKKQVERLSETLQAPGAAAKAGEAGGQKAGQGEEARRLVAALKSTLAPDESRLLFENWSPSDDWARPTETIPSTPVARGIGHGIWKFTWRVRLIGNEASEKSWDPCIYGHESKPRP